MSYGLDGQGIGVQFPTGASDFLFSTTSRLTVRPTQWVPVAPSAGVKWLRPEADHSPPSSAKVKNVWSYTSIISYSSKVWSLIKNENSSHFN
jgi:hypothetical protein